MTTKESAYKTVLCLFKDRTFKVSGDAQMERQNLLDSIRVTLSDVLACSEGSSALSYFLQTEKFIKGGMSDLLGHIEDRGTVCLPLHCCKNLLLIHCVWRRGLHANVLH